MRRKNTSPETVLLFVSESMKLEGIQIISIDFKGAYLQSNSVYNDLPKGFLELNPEVNEHVMKLLKSLYGLKEAGRLWFRTLKEFSLTFGFKQANFDRCLFIHIKFNLNILLYVDGCLFSGKPEDVKWLLQSIRKKFEIKQTSLKDFLGFQISLKEAYAKIHMNNYVQKVIASLRLEHTKFVETRNPHKVKVKTLQ